MKWIMLVYRLPRFNTTAKKVAVWRKLKKLGVYPLQDSVCILPGSERTLENFEWLADEIKEMGGDATLWEIKGMEESQEDIVREFFINQINRQYMEIISDTKKAGSIKELKNLWALFNQVKTQDYLRSPLWVEVKGALENKASELSRRDDL